MTSDQERVKELFDQAFDMEPDERANFLLRACGNDVDLRCRVDDLFSAHEEAASRFLPANEMEHDLSGNQDRADRSELRVESVGDVIDRYKLLENIGEGGFGTVWAAEQKQPIKRRVALKLIKLGMDTKQVVARFEAERQALAMMDHPNIANVLDAGSTRTGRPYFVMELVHGVPITDYCDQVKLTTNGRVELFVKVCRAVQHAHQRGIIHRDIKPSNILVTLHDGVPVPKIIDFGIAKATQQELTDKTIYTKFHHFVGTSAYISPEQAELSGLDIDTRCDIYSLGVLLYELLTGTTPFAAKELLLSGLDEMRKIIRERVPTRPSTKIKSLGAKERTSIAERHGVDEQRLSTLLSGDLDWIVMKCLEKDRTRRYETATALARDLQRHLNNEPVIARPPTTAYRLQRYWQRNRFALATAALVATTLVAGTCISVWQAITATKASSEAMVQRAAALAAQKTAEDQRAVAERQASRATKIAQILNDMLSTADPTKGKSADHTVRAMLDEFAATLDGRFADDPEVEIAVRHTIGRAYYHLGLHNTAEPHLRQALELCTVDSSDRLNEALILTDLAQVLLFIGHGPRWLEDSEEILRKAISIHRERETLSPEVANSYCMLGWILWNKTRGLLIPPHANESYRINLEGIRILEPHSDVRSLELQGRMCTGLAWELLRSGSENDVREAEEFSERAITLLHTNAEHGLFLPMSHAVHGRCQVRLGNHQKAEASFREACRLEKLRTGWVGNEYRFQLMVSLLLQAKFTDAIQSATEEPKPNAWPTPLSPNFVHTQAEVVTILIGLGDFERAESILRHWLSTSLANFGPDNLVTLVIQRYLAQALLAQHDSDNQAETQELITTLAPAYRTAAETGPEHVVHDYTFAIGNQQSPTASDLDYALKVNERLLKQSLTPLRRIRNLYAGALLQKQAGEIGRALAMSRAIVESPIAYTWDPEPGDSPYYTLRNAEDLLAHMLSNACDRTAAEQVYREGVTRRENAARTDQYQILLAKLRLAKFLSRHGKNEEGHGILLSVRDALSTAPPCFEWLAEQVQDELDAIAKRETSDSINRRSSQ